jgi:DNA polymerase-3 subunit gamma/tau
MRDGLSLLDQAIAYGAGKLEESTVRAMLGVVDREFLYRIVDALAAGDGAALLAEASALAERGLSLSSALDELASLFHRMAVAQAVPDAASHFDDGARVVAAAARFTPEAVQLAYQICVQGRTDLPLAPDESTGFAMTLLRLLAFEPAKRGADAAPSGGGARGDRPAPGASVRAAAAAAPTSTRAAAPANVSNIASLRAAAETPARASATPRADPSTPSAALPPPDEWPAFVAGLKLTGMAAQLAAQSELRAVKGNALTLALPTSHRHLADKAYADKLKVALEAVVGRRLLLAFEVGETTDASLAAQERRERAEAKAKGDQAFRAEPFVRELITRFDGRVKPETVEPLPASSPDTPTPSQDSAP